MIKHIFRNGTTATELKDVYVPKKHMQEVTKIANSCEKDNKEKTGGDKDVSY